MTLIICRIRYCKAFSAAWRMTVVPSVRQNRRYCRGCCGGCPGSTAEGACITKMHLVSRADLYAVIPYGHPRIRTRKAPRLSLSPDSSAELKAAMPRLSEGGRHRQSKAERDLRFFCSRPVAVPHGTGAIGGRHLMKKKAPTDTVPGGGRGIVTAVRAVIGRRGLPGQMMGRIGAFRHQCPFRKAARSATGALPQSGVSITGSVRQASGKPDKGIPMPVRSVISLCFAHFSTVQTGAMAYTKWCLRIFVPVL